MVNPNPLGPRRTIIGGFRQLTRGDMSLHGETSLDEALLDHPGDCKESSDEGIITERFVVDDDLTMDLSNGDNEVLVLRVFLVENVDDARGLGVLGWTEDFGVTGRLLELVRSNEGFRGKHEG